MAEDEAEDDRCVARWRRSRPAPIATSTSTSAASAASAASVAKTSATDTIHYADLAAALLRSPQYAHAYRFDKSKLVRAELDVLLQEEAIDSNTDAERRTYQLYDEIRKWMRAHVEQAPPATMARRTERLAQSLAKCAETSSSQLLQLTLTKLPESRRRVVGVDEEVRFGADDRPEEEVEVDDVRVDERREQRKRQRLRNIRHLLDDCAKVDA